MKNYKCIVCYDGSKYNGWQRLHENSDKTIQGKIESILSKYLNEDVFILGSGRTDKGVHAKMQVFNFKIQKDVFYEHPNFLKEINHYLPEDIKITSCILVEDRFHARHSAKNKIYLYRIDNSIYGDPFIRKYAYYIEKNLNVELMKECSKLFIGEHDFKSFSKNSGKKKSTIKKLTEIKFNVLDGNIIEIYFHGEGFLYNMVRMLTGALIQVGLGKNTIKDIKTLLDEKTRNEQRFVVPPNGLFLYSVEY